MTASEFAFLAMGLILGVAAGAALIEVLRARPPAPREVRVTMSTDAVPRRSTTLAEATHAVSHAEPARGGPADRREESLPAVAGSLERRTAVLPAATATGAVNEAVAPGRVMEPMFPLRDPARAPAGATPAGMPASAGAIPVSGGTDPMMGALRASAAAAATAAIRAGTTTAVMDEDDAGDARSAPHAEPDAGLQPSAAAGRPSADTRRPSAPVPSAPVPSAQVPSGGHDGDVAGHAQDDGPCSEVRRIADERCELATRAREQALASETALRAAQRAYDEHDARADAAQAAADPRAIRQAKDTAQERFRTDRGKAATTDEIEAAARTWLSAVNAINGAMREAAAALTRERAAAQELGASLERRALETDAARISAETAEAACLEAREAVASCDEASVGGTVPHLPTPAHAPGGPFAFDDADTEADPLAAALAGGASTPRIFRLVRGDRTAMSEVVAALAAADPDDHRRWQLAVADLVDAIIADAIESGTLEFPTDHSFWGPFTVEQDRDIVRALASLGYRFDGLGGWLDGRIPGQRDLSLALGYAGLDPMRLRHWPNETEMGALFEEVEVAADEHLAGAAGDLTLGELVSMLGRRADGLADLWNHWGKIRPLLLEDS